MQKRYFPKNFSLPAHKPNSNKRLASKTRIRKVKNSGRNLKHEFDIIIRQSHTMLSDDQVDRLWKHIGTLLIQAPNSSLEELIGTLDIQAHIGSVE